MDRPRLPLGSYYQLLYKLELLVDKTTPFPGDLTHVITAVTCDSRSAVPGCLFICKGAAFKEEYLAEAIRRGAVAYVSEKVYDQPAPCLQVTNIRMAMGVLADHAWGHPSGRLTVIGITGTKGKTTAAWFLKAILDHWRQRQGKPPVGLLSTILIDDGVERRPAALTTPEPLDLQRHLFNAANAGCEYVVMEVSSQALKYGRMIGVELAVAAFLNIGEDHISPAEHPTWADYFSSKLRIFNHARSAVINLDGEKEQVDRILENAKYCERVVTYSSAFPNVLHADLSAQAISPIEGGQAFAAAYEGEGEPFALSMGGDFNVSNALAAMGVCRILGVPGSDVRAGLFAASIPGRMETYVNQEKTVIVDYAHNGMALTALLQGVRKEHPGAPITLVFGCTGDKALDRREGMGRAAGEYADTILLTEDDPGHERVEDICTQIESYVNLYGKPCTIIPNREEAIRRAIEEAPPGGVVILAGKGAEQAQKRANGPEPCVPDGMLAKKYLGL